MDKTCSILGIGYNWEEVNPNLLKQLINEIKRLISNEGVTQFLIEQSYCRSSAVRIINHIKERNEFVKLNLVVQCTAELNYDIDYFKDRYGRGFDGVVRFDPKTKVLRARNLRTYKWMIDQSDYLLCCVKDDSSANQSILRHASRKRTLQIINLCNTVIL
jgi:hypothetical protein